MSFMRFYNYNWQFQTRNRAGERDVVEAYLPGKILHDILYDPYATVAGIIASIKALVKRICRLGNGITVIFNRADFEEFKNYLEYDAV
jgi:hypothetical protein